MDSGHMPPLTLSSVPCGSRRRPLILAGCHAPGHRDYRVYLICTMVGQVGTWMQTVTQSWLVLELTDSPFKLGLIGTLQFGPILLLSVFTGVLADRVTRRTVLFVTQSTQGGLAAALGLFAWSGHARYWRVAVVGLIWGIMSAIDQPARQSLMTELVRRRYVASAVGLNSVSFNVARVVGPSTAGLLIARGGLSFGSLLNAIAFLFAIALLTQIPGRRPVSRLGRTVVDDMLEGVRYVLRTPAVRFILALQIIVSFCVFNFSVYVPLPARSVFGMGADGFGLLMMYVGFGALCAGVAVGGLGTSARGPGTIATGLAVVCGALLGLSVARVFWLAAILLAITGFAGTIVVVGCNTSLQLLAPHALRGRVMSLYTLLSGGVFPIGAFWVGFVAERWGVSCAFLANGVAGVTALGALLLWHQAAYRRVSENPRNAS